MRALYTRFIKDNAGVTAIEYGLIAALVAVVCITAWKLLGTESPALRLAASLTAYRLQNNSTLPPQYVGRGRALPLASLDLSKKVWLPV